MKSGNKQIINVVTLDIDKCCEGKETGEWLGWHGTRWVPGLWGRDTKWSLYSYSTHLEMDPPRVPYAFLSHEIPFGHNDQSLCLILYFCIADTSDPIFLRTEKNLNM